MIVLSFAIPDDVAFETAVARLKVEFDGDQTPIGEMVLNHQTEVLSPQKPFQNFVPGVPKE